MFVNSICTEICLTGITNIFTFTDRSNNERVFRQVKHLCKFKIGNECSCVEFW